MAARASANWSVEKLLTPMYLIRPESASDSMARMVSPMGVRGFGQWTW